MVKKLEPVSVELAHTIIGRALELSNAPKQMRITVIAADQTAGAIPTVGIQSMCKGMDWERDYLLITPTQPLTVLSPEQVKDIQTSMRAGGNWHAFQRYQKQQNQIDLLQAQVDALKKHVVDSFMDHNSTDSGETNKDLMDFATSHADAIIAAAKPSRQPRPVRSE